MRTTRTNVMPMQIILLLLIFVALSSCATPQINQIESVSLLTKETEFTNNEQTYTLKTIGMIKAEFSSRENLYKFSVLYPNMTFCDSDEKLIQWYEILPEHTNRHNAYRYSLLFGYKSHSSNSSYIYNLAENPRKLCFSVVASSMFPPSSRLTNTIEFTLSDSLIEQIKQYDAASGIARFDRPIQ